MAESLKLCLQSVVILHMKGFHEICLNIVDSKSVIIGNDNIIYMK